MDKIFHLSISDNLLVNILILGFTTFLLSMLITPIYTTVAYKYKWWKKIREDSWSGGKATVYAKIHAAKHRRNIPNMAGLIFIVSIAIITLFLNLKRSQTWLPLAGMVGAGIIGLIDDIMNITGTNKRIAGMQAKIKFALYSIVALIGGWWFYYKLNVHSFYLPYFHEITIGVFIIILFWIVVISTANAVNITDGLDGLAGGLLTTSFATYSFICVIEHKYALAGLCITIVGALLSYTCFRSIPVSLNAVS